MLPRQPLHSPIISPALHPVEEDSLVGRRGRQASRRAGERSHCSRSSRWRSSSSSGEFSSSSEVGSGHCSRRPGSSADASPRPVCLTASLPASADSAAAVPPPSSPANGESSLAHVWGVGTRDASFFSALKSLVEQFSAPFGVTPSGTASVNPPEPPRASIHRDSVFCGVSPLGAHLENDVKEKI